MQREFYVIVSSKPLQGDEWRRMNATSLQVVAESTDPEEINNFVKRELQQRWAAENEKAGLMPLPRRSKEAIKEDLLRLFEEIQEAL